MFSIAYKAPFLPREQNIVGHTATSISRRQSRDGVGTKHIIGTENLSLLGTESKLAARKGVKLEHAAKMRSQEVHSRNWTVAIWALIYMVVGSACFAQDIVLIDSSLPSAEQQTIRRLADFYGLKFDLVEVGSPEANFRAFARVKATDTLAVLASQEALAELDHKHVQMALQRTRGRSIPLLVFGVAADQDQSGLQFWSGGAVQECVPLADGFRPKALEVAQVAPPITGPLAGVELPAAASPACAMQPGPAPSAQTVLSVRGPDGTKAALLVRVQTNSGERFFVSQMKYLDRSWIGDPGALPEAFSAMAPFILFLSYAAGEYAWHSDGHYANLTIDDAWLTQPYGHLDYPALLAEMEKHNFHTTIAFIPWNFDRSESGTVALFRAHPERFSICIHGNDHEHREFGDYALNSLPEQIANIKQGVARMERFQALTGIPYDRFMVFPQGVAPEATFTALKTYEFLGTANYQNVPLGTPFPTDSAFLLRPYTVAYGNLLSYSRYNASGPVPQVEIAVQSFLGNPVLLYGHESVFDSGITAFNNDADFVNKLQPGTSWVSLGGIARHSYLLRRRKDGGFDVRMLSNEMDLKNPTDADAIFYIQRATDAAVDFSLTIDGARAAFEHSGKLLTLRIVIPGGQVRKIRVTYQNDFDLLREDIGKRKLHAYVLRRISDFRDLYLSRSSTGQAFTRFYYRHGWASIEQYAERNWWVGLVGVGTLVAGIGYRRRRARRRVARAVIAR